MKKIIDPIEKPSNEKPKRKRMRSFEAAPDVAQMLDVAAAGGVVITEVTNAALRKYGPEVIKEHIKKLREQADSLERNISASKR